MDTRSQKVWEIWESAKYDPQYVQMLEELSPLERRYNEVLHNLSVEDQDVIFVRYAHLSGQLLEPFQ